jgi:hypothetical protein
MENTMTTENPNIAENTTTTQETPAPVTPAPQVETTGSEAAPKADNPSNSQDEAVKKQNAAFAQMRRAKREAERKAAQTIPATTPPSAPVIQEPAKPEPVAVAPAPVQNITEGIEVESEKAILELAEDKDLAKVANGLYDVIALVDNDPRLVRLHGIDPKLAFKEAKEIYLSKAGISTPPPIPKSSTPSGGIGVGANNLEALYAETQKYVAGTRQWHKAVNAFNAESKRLTSGG